MNQACLAYVAYAESKHCVELVSDAEHAGVKFVQAASVVVFTEYPWHPGDLKQAEDRAHRIGQPSSVNIYNLHVRGSVDDIMWSKLQAKIENVGQVKGQDLRVSVSSTDIAAALPHNGLSSDPLPCLFRRSRVGLLWTYIMHMHTIAVPMLGAKLLHGQL